METEKAENQCHRLESWTSPGWFHIFSAVTGSITNFKLQLRVSCRAQIAKIWSAGQIQSTNRLYPAHSCPCCTPDGAQHCLFPIGQPMPCSHPQLSMAPPWPRPQPACTASQQDCSCCCWRHPGTARHPPPPVAPPPPLWDNEVSGRRQRKCLPPGTGAGCCSSLGRISCHPSWESLL